MWVFLVLLAVIFILMLYFMISVGQLSYQLFSKIITHKVLLRVVSLFPLFLFVIGLLIDTTNAITVDIYAILIVLLTKLVFGCIQVITKVQFGKYVSLIVGIVITMLVLGNSYYKAYHVVETKYQVTTAKPIGDRPFRIVQVADSHIGTTMDGKKFSEYMNQINQLNPDIVVITGDLVDDGTTLEEMQDAAKGLGQLKTKYGVFFVYGNHDKGYYHKRPFTEKDLEEELQKNHVTILQDEVTSINDQIILVGRQDKEVQTRMRAQDLTKDIDKSKFIIMLDHQPNDYENEQKAGADLVLSGHTHGGQMFPLGQLGVLMKANDFLYGHTQRENTHYIVTSGISDWAMKFKLGTKSEYVVIDVTH